MSRRSGTTEPPRLVLRFAVLTALGMGLAACAILLIVRHFNISEAERQASQKARFAAAAAIGDEVRPADFRTRVTPGRRNKLDARFRRHLLHETTVGGALVRADGVVTYATDRELIGTRIRVGNAVTGAVVSRVTTIGDPARAGQLKVLESVVPVDYPDEPRPMLVVVHQDYKPIAEAAKSIFLPVAGVLELALVLIWIVLVPALGSVTRRIRRQVDEIEHLANHDTLTGLPNRRLFGSRVEQALHERTGDAELAVLLIDLDRFKEINDTLGHASGDELLRSLATRLEEVRRPRDTIARLGGDEFGVLLPQTTQAETLEVARRTREVIERPVTLSGIPVTVEASVGVARAPEHGDDVETLIQRADVAMYKAKERHAGVEVYDLETDSNDAGRLTLMTELKGAIERGELFLAYQPKVSASDGAVRGVEALVRWHHPVRGVVPPTEFVPLAERTGLIKPLTRWVLEAALRQCRIWADEGLETAVAVNLTMIDLLDGTLPDEIAVLLEREQLPARCLELEITESTIMADPLHVSEVLGRLSMMGIKLAIDDFGTGYTSLGYLKRLPIDAIKIDRSFVIGMATERGDATIVRSVIDIGRNLGLEIVAEGVESKEIWDQLLRFGCHQVQGYYVARPLPADATGTFLEARAPGWSIRLATAG
jgi:diguanylate cyclase (GGDEF)-like protein